MRAPFKTAAYLFAVAVALVAIAVAVGCGSARAQSWGVGGCPAPAPLPVWQPLPVVIPSPPSAPALKPEVNPVGVGNSPGAGWRWAFLPGVGYGWVHESVPTPDAPKAMPKAKTPGCKCEPCDCGPCECGRPEQAPAPRTTFGQIPPGGVDWAKMPAHAEGEYRLNGRPCDPRLAIAAVGGEPSGGVPDDADYPWLTVIGPEADRDRVLTAVREGAAFNGVKLRLKGFPAGHKAVKDYPPGLIHLQAANGRPLLTLAGYDGPDKLAASIKAALDGYDPAQDPGVGKPYPKKPRVDPDQPRKPRPCDADGNRWVKCLVGFAAAVILFLLKRGA